MRYTNIIFDSISSSKYIKVHLVEFYNFGNTRLVLVKILDSQLNINSKYFFDLKSAKENRHICYFNNSKIYSLYYNLNSLNYINKSDVLAITNRLLILQNIYFKNVRRMEKLCNYNDNKALFNQKNIYYITKTNINKLDNTLLSDTQNIDRYNEYYYSHCSPVRNINIVEEIHKRISIINRKNKLILSDIKNQLDNKQLVFFYILPSRIIYKLNYSRVDSIFFKLSNVEDWECLNTPIINCKVID